MIFVTVGTDSPFDRLIQVVDNWARDRNRSDVFAQVGNGGYEPQFISFKRRLSPLEFADRVQDACVVVAHAGMGTILSALYLEKPILVMPKIASLGEQRNEHQSATAMHMARMGWVTVAFNEAELREKLEEVDVMVSVGPIPAVASGPLVGGLRKFIFRSA
jgi:UDP-N-acetylglucosamine transferase subunit ALG13